ncbi:hypothetical protein MAR_019981 [Mya arenaria]|uniref:Uncharacterized protein n=1 Tax=Mya arenaria TaxID=6604 RepID=A0ABY7E3P8_MYAAR|nr:hypothetical protein MAR_019981 [Mya arenaria]
MMMNAMTKPTCVTIIVQTRKGRIAAHVERDICWTQIIALVLKRLPSKSFERREMRNPRRTHIHLYRAKLNAVGLWAIAKRSRKYQQ